MVKGQASFQDFWAHWQTYSAPREPVRQLSERGAERGVDTAAKPGLVKFRMGCLVERLLSVRYARLMASLGCHGLDLMVA